MLNLRFRAASAASGLLVNPKAGGDGSGRRQHHPAGREVDNRGTVLAQMGGGLGAGSDLTLNFDGNKLLDIRVDAGVANAL